MNIKNFSTLPDMMIIFLQKHTENMGGKQNQIVQIKANKIKIWKKKNTKWQINLKAIKSEPDPVEPYGDKCFSMNMFSIDSSEYVVLTSLRQWQVTFHMSVYTERHAEFILSRHVQST